MKETTPAAMPACFERWCKRFDDVFSHQAQKREFRHYIGRLLGESERKNLSQMADNAVGVTYHRLHHFLTEAPWSAQEVNERRLQRLRGISSRKRSLPENRCTRASPTARTKDKGRTSGLNTDDSAIANIIPTENLKYFSG